MIDLFEMIILKLITELIVRCVTVKKGRITSNKYAGAITFVSRTTPNLPPVCVLQLGVYGLWPHVCHSAIELPIVLSPTGHTAIIRFHVGIVCET